jgi:hypothetical protein
MRQTPHNSDAERSRESAPNGQRDARGRFTRRNAAALTHGARSQQRSLLLAPIRQEVRAAILSDVGHTDADVPRALSIIIDQLAEARLIAQSYFEFLAASGGPITTKGRQRRAVEGWSKAAAHVAKFASMIGLERRARKIVESPQEWLERLAREQQEQEGRDDDEAPNVAEQTGRIVQTEQQTETDDSTRNR